MQNPLFDQHCENFGKFWVHICQNDDKIETGKDAWMVMTSFIWEYDYELCYMVRRDIESFQMYDNGGILD